MPVSVEPDAPQTDEQLVRSAELARQLRVDAVRAAAEAGSGHPTSAMSAADLMAVLMTSYLRYDFDRPSSPANDALIFSKGHATPLLYAMFKAAGAIDDEELLTYRKAGSGLEGHPAPVVPWIPVATGSLGQGLPIGAGLAQTARDLDHQPARVWVLCGDSEMTEGSMWEAVEYAGHEGLGRLTAVIDVNRLGQTRPTRYEWDLEVYDRRLRSFGWDTVQIDGHDPASVASAYEHAVDRDERPTAILARTVKGRGSSEVADQLGKHGKPLQDPEAAIDELGGPGSMVVDVEPPETSPPPRTFSARQATFPTWRPEPDAQGEVEQVATRTAYGEALTALLDERPDVVVLDAEVANSTRAEYAEEAHPERFFEHYTAEQQMLSTAVAMQSRGWRPFAASFAAFLSRAHDFIRMAAVSRAHLSIVGSHAGVSIGRDGPSQMGLEDLAMFRSLDGSCVLYPSDPNQVTDLVRQMADWPGIAYLRTTRGETPVIYPPGTQFPIGGSQVVRSSDEDDLSVVAAGVTLHEALAAHDRLADEGIRARVIDLYSVKPVDDATLRAALDATGGRMVSVEDHRVEGGLGEAVLAALATHERPYRVERLGVTGMPGSADSDEQLAAAGIHRDDIVAAGHRLASSGPLHDPNPGGARR